jgi:hypothetical protein
MKNSDTYLIELVPRLDRYVPAKLRGMASGVLLQAQILGREGLGTIGKNNRRTARRPRSSGFGGCTG